MEDDKKSLKKHKKVTKEHLKTMTKNSNSHNFRTKRRVLKYGALNFGRNIWLSMAATLVMTITLVVLFATVLASAVLSATADTMREKIDITIYFKPQTSKETLETMKGTMQKNSNVKEVTIADSGEEYNKFVEDYKNDTQLMNTLNDDSMKELMLQSMQATMRIKVKDINNLDGIKAIETTDADFIENMDPSKPPSHDTNNSQIETISSWANIAKTGGLVLSVVFLVVSVLVIFNTIRMAIFSRREEIYMMKLVGADTSFIRGPFLVEAQICGFISGVLAATIGYVGFEVLAPKLGNYGINVAVIANILESNKLIIFYAVMILAGMLIGWISARLAISKYLRSAK